MAKYVYGISSSQYSGECGDRSIIMTDEEFKNECIHLTAMSQASAKADVLKAGDILDFNDDPTSNGDTIEYTQIKDVGVDSDWLCDGCKFNEPEGYSKPNPEGCASCNGTGYSGETSGGGRFVVIHNGEPYLAVTRFYTCIEGDK